MCKPVIGIPMGDPAGIGPEIIVKALNNKTIYDFCNPVVIGDISILEQIENIIKTGLKLNVISHPDDGKYIYGTVDVISLNNMDVSRLKFGEIQADAGKAAFEYIKRLVEFTVDGKINAIATTPINKESLRAAGINYIGHTEILAGLTNIPDPLTMFQVYDLRVFFLSRHVSLQKACEIIKKERLEKYIKRCTDAMNMLGLINGRLAVAGLNPHNGEHGLFGDEEVNEIEPAIVEMRKQGYNVVGPIPADSVFYQALKGKYDAVLSLYHDQGHIATKTVDFEKTISLTIGMPFLRTSVDHGTAFDIAWKGLASPVSMIEAIRLASEYSSKYHFSCC